MKCPACGNERLTDDARFCPQCGTKLNPVVAPIAEAKPAPHVELTQDVQRIEGGEVAGVKMGDVHGNVVVQLSLGAEQLAALNRVAAMSTEVAPHAGSQNAPAATAQEVQALKGEINHALAQLNAANRQGAQATEVQAGGVQISKVELLVKQAVLIKTEAEQMMFDHVTKKQQQFSAGPLHGSAPAMPPDMNAMLADFNRAPYMAKLKEAQGLLEEANKLDPTDTEVLLHMAQLLGQLTPDDPSDEQRLLYRISQLLDPPKDDTERFRLAQTVFMLAMSSRPVNMANLQNARDMFEKLGRTDWVRYCENIHASLMSGGGMTPGGGVTQPAQFQPVGRWHIQINDVVRSQMWLECYPNGSFQSSQQAPGFIVQATGQWGFNPYNQMLQLQGLVNGMQPFMLGIVIQGQQPNGYMAMGTDGLQYFLTRAG